jgi:hypothetical protein
MVKPSEKRDLRRRFMGKLFDALREGDEKSEKLKGNGGKWNRL